MRPQIAVMAPMLSGAQPGCQWGGGTRTEIGVGILLCLIFSVAVGAFLIRSLTSPIGSDVRYLSVRSAPARRVAVTSWRRAAPRPAVRAPWSRY